MCRGGAIGASAPQKISTLFFNPLFTLMNQWSTYQSILRNSTRSSEDSEPRASSNVTSPLNDGANISTETNSEPDSCPQPNLIKLDDYTHNKINYSDKLLMPLCFSVLCTPMYKPENNGNERFSAKKSGRDQNSGTTPFCSLSPLKLKSWDTEMIIMIKSSFSIA